MLFIGLVLHPLRADTNLMHSISTDTMRTRLLFFLLTTILFLITSPYRDCGILSFFRLFTAEDQYLTAFIFVAEGL